MVGGDRHRPAIEGWSLVVQEKFQQAVAVSHSVGSVGEDACQEGSV